MGRALPGAIASPQRKAPSREAERVCDVQHDVGVGGVGAGAERLGDIVEAHPQEVADALGFGGALVDEFEWQWIIGGTSISTR